MCPASLSAGMFIKSMSEISSLLGSGNFLSTTAQTWPFHTNHLHPSGGVRCCSSKIVSEILKDVGQEKNVPKKIVIVIILDGFHVVVSTNLFFPIIDFLREGFVN